MLRISSTTQSTFQYNLVFKIISYIIYTNGSDYITWYHLHIKKGELLHTYICTDAESTMVWVLLSCSSVIYTLTAGSGNWTDNLRSEGMRSCLSCSSLVSWNYSQPSSRSMCKARFFRGIFKSHAHVTNNCNRKLLQYSHYKSDFSQQKIFAFYCKPLYLNNTNKTDKKPTISIIN